MQTITLPTGGTLDIDKDVPVTLYGFYVNIKSGFIGYCMCQNDADAMNLIREIGFNPYLNHDGNMWYTCYPNEEQLKPLRKQYGIKWNQKWPHEKVNP